jgi:two-component system, LytTR family, sensor kinase
VKTYIKYSLIAWLVFSLLGGWIMYEMSDRETSAIRLLSHIIPEMMLFYGNLLWLSCKYLENKKKKIYFGLLSLLILIHVFMFAPIDIYLDKHYPLDMPHFKERPIFMVYLGRLFSSVPPLVLSALMWKSLQLQKEREESLELKHQVLEAETKALKAQINPHFLFNSMNNIYSLSQLKSDKTGDAILQLSEILRFVTYECEKDRVSLEDELKQINNFIQLQLLKDDDNSNVQYKITETFQQLTIAPMLLLPFIENGFKHSNIEDKENGWIKIDIHIEDNKLIMNLANSAFISKEKKDGTGGVGMENVKKRLTLIYPDKHSLRIKQDREKYTVELIVDLKE